jgi:hypothetical protein
MIVETGLLIKAALAGVKVVTAHAAHIGAAHAAATHAGAHGLAANWAAASHHPLEWSLHQSAQHGIHAAEKAMMDPNASLGHKLALAQIAYSQATGHAAATAASAAAPINWHTVAELAEPFAASMAMRSVRESEAYTKLKKALSALCDETRDLKDLPLDQLEAWVANFLASIRHQNA